MQQSKSLSSQRGAALLAITALLMVLASLGALTINNVGQVEQRVAGNDVRAKEVYSAALGALEYGASWLDENFETVVFTDADADGESESGDTATPDALANLVLNADSYSRTVTYTLRSSINPVDFAMPRVIEIAATATALNDTHISKTVRTTTMLATTSFFSPQSTSGLGFSGPPIMVENCFGSITGNPDVFPDNGVAVGTTNGTADDTCLPPGHLNLNGGSREALPTPQTLWETIFGAGKTEADLLALQDLMPDRVFFVDDGYPYYPLEQPAFATNWQATVGTEDAPVILYFADGYCPKMNGGPTIWGLVYYADDDCSSQGFGGGTIHGTLAKSGDMTKLNANADVHGTPLDFGASSDSGTGTSIEIGFNQPKFTKMPGSWRDF